MNLAELTRRTRKHLAEAGGAVHNDTDIQAELNRSARTLAGTLSLFKARTNIIATNGRANVPDDLLSIINVTNPARRVTLEPVDAASMASDPNIYPTGGTAWGYSFDPAWGRALNIYPPRSETLSIVYRAAPPAMEDATSTPWGGAYEDWHDLIALHAAQSLSGLTGASGAKEPIWLQRLALRLEEFRDHLALQALDTPPTRIAAYWGPRRRR